MFRIMCKSKIHSAIITSKKLYYQGSVRIAKELMNAAQILPNEKVQVVNLYNGNRFTTYVIRGEKGSGICLLGPAARLGEPGDKVTIISYCIIEDAKAKAIRPKIVKVNEKNRILK